MKLLMFELPRDLVPSRPDGRFSERKLQSRDGFVEVPGISSAVPRTATLRTVV